MASERQEWRVEGMDCASCVEKISRAIGQMPGVAEVTVNLMAERMSLLLMPEKTTAEDIRRRMESLGYTATPLAAPAASSGRASESPQSEAMHKGEHGHGDHSEGVEDGSKPWWNTGKARLVWLLAGLVLAAQLLSWTLTEKYAYPLFLLATLVALIPFGRRAFEMAKAGQPFSIETLMCVAAIGAAILGAAEEAAVVVLLFAIGELLENVAAGRARAGIRALAKLMPRVALRLRPDGGTDEIAAEQLAVGDVILVRPGDRIACDGTILEGGAGVDESAVTGESVPVPRGKGDAVVAGSISTDGALRVNVDRIAADNTIARIISMVEEATASRAPTQRFIERFSAWWTPGAMIVSALVMLVPPFALGWDWWTSIYRGLAVLLIACPCALVISVPAAMASGLSAGARRGLLVKGGAALEILGSAKVAAFDKTGTLTEGKPAVTDAIPSPGITEEELIVQAAAVEQGSAHPLAKAILAEAQRRGLTLPVASEQTAIPGRAVTARIGDSRVSVGSPRYAVLASEEFGMLAEPVGRLEGEGKTIAAVLRDDKPLGVLALRDEPRTDAEAGVARLKEIGIRSIMLTGDNKRTGAAVAQKLGMDVVAELLPDEKLREIARLREEGAVIMVGDGINDAPALAAASIGVAMGGGTDVALETAEAAVLKDRVSGIAELVTLSRTTLRNVKQNVAVAIGLKGIFLITTMLGITGLWPAILADTGATVLVTLNALRLLKWKPSW